MTLVSVCLPLEVHTINRITALFLGFRSSTSKVLAQSRWNKQVKVPNYSFSNPLKIGVKKNTFSVRNEIWFNK